ncbi:MAG: hypothetical protein M0C28_36950 [Candidatus Moduliflexus flocculans]|nr:hypothetical protein [Candidatus Moduliflexus flocculans]
MRAIPTLKIGISGVRGVVGDSLTPELRGALRPGLRHLRSAAGGSSWGATHAPRARWCGRRSWRASPRAAAG